jgi:prepilin-type N-terminal cleavage/methylation domain-containing protein
MIKNEKGFTLIELMLATVILVISIIPITMILPRMLTENRIVERENRAVFLGQKIMEETKTKALTYFNWDGYNKTAIAFSSPYNIFKYSVTYASVAGMDNNIRKITVTVWYDEIDNGAVDTGEEWIQLKTLITNRGESI